MAEIIVFGPKAAERTKEAVKKVETMVFPYQRPTSRYPIISGAALQIVEGLVTSAITPFNSNTNTYGLGSVAVYRPTINANSGAIQSVLDTSFNANGIVNCYNWSVNSGTINTNTHVWMYQRNTANASLIFELIGADC